MWQIGEQKDEDAGRYEGGPCVVGAMTNLCRKPFLFSPKALFLMKTFGSSPTTSFSTNAQDGEGSYPRYHVTDIHD